MKTAHSTIKYDAKIRSTEGFSLVELMTYLTLLALLSASLYTGFNYFLQTKVEVSQTAALQSKAALSLNELRDQIRNAEDLTIEKHTASDTHCVLIKNVTSEDRTGLRFIGVGASKNIMIQNYLGPTGTTSRTAMLWLRTNDLPAATARTILMGWGSTATGSGDKGKDFYLFLERSTDSDGNPRLQFGVDVNGASIKSANYINQGQWNHVAVTFDRDESTNFNTNSIKLYINGGVETSPIVAGTANQAINTGNQKYIRLGGQFSTEFGNGNNFRGAISNVRLWERVLSGTEIRTERSLASAASSTDLKMDFPLTSNLTGGSISTYSLDTANNFFANSSYTSAAYDTYSDDYIQTEKVVAFGADSNTDFYRLFTAQRPAGGSIGCVDPSDDGSGEDTAKSGWETVAGNSLWKRTEPLATNIFELESRPGGQTVEINAEITTQTGEGYLETGAGVSVLAATSERDADLCRIAPNMVGFDTGDSDISEVVVTIDTESFEPGFDILKFMTSSPVVKTTETVGSSTIPVWYYDNIRDSIAIEDGAEEIATNLTGKFFPTLGYIKIYTRSGDTISSAVDTAVELSLSDWERVLRQLTYDSTAQAYLPSKEFLFSLGPNIPCKINNYIACRNIDNDDGDNNPATCYHWFNFIKFTDLGSSYDCAKTYRGGSGTQTEYNNGDYNADSADCVGDWENTREHARHPDRNLFGMQGYLATLTTPEENVCGLEKINGALGWLGASDRQCERNRSCSSASYTGTVSRDSAGENHWYWVTGPEGEFNANDSFYKDHQGSGGTPQSNGLKHALWWGHQNTSAAVNFAMRPTGTWETTLSSGQTVNLKATNNQWPNSEPNNWSWVNEDYLHTLPDGRWNDYTSWWKVHGYLIEYGGRAGDPERRLVKLASIDTLEFLKACRE